MRVPKPSKSRRREEVHEQLRKAVAIAPLKRTLPRDTGIRSRLTSQFSVSDASVTGVDRFFEGFQAVWAEAIRVVRPQVLQRRLVELDVAAPAAEQTAAIER